MNESEIQTGFTVDRAAAAMWDVPELEDRARALAAISLIADKHNDLGYEYVPSGCPHGSGAVLTGYSESRWVQVHFHGDAGAVVFLWDIDAEVLLPHEEGEAAAEWRTVFAQVPDSLRSCLWNDLSKSPFEDTGVDLPYITAVMWRLPGDTAWQTPDSSSDESVTPVEGWIDYDRAESVLADLIAPSPATVMFDDALGVERSSFAIADAVRQVLALRPLTEDIVRTLNPERRLADVADAITAIGYRPAHPHTAPPLDRGVGEGTALVTVPDFRSFTVKHFLLEPDGQGFHRIMVHHSGKALEAAGTTSGAGVVQSEPHDRDGQKFLIQVYRDNAFHDCGRIPGFSDEYDDGQDACVETGTVYRIIAKESGLALQAGAYEGAPVQLAPPHDAAITQRFRRGDLYGYGLWMFLTPEDTHNMIGFRQ
ncbi:RICIN domain-containing protein [Streptomyces sp. NPDC088348]|uniref:RICIN domain-containing protein n=1 Tax=Streptomyces sp. NPDC088348 TaxID=3365853 RepID=UPI003820C3B6